jgi:pseudouridine synthase
VYTAKKDGLVRIDGKVRTNKDYQFKLSSTVTYNDKKLTVPKNDAYLLLNKPEGYLCSKLSETDVKLDKKSVFDLVICDAAIKNTLSCVGRLDENSSGLLILTNDGKLNVSITNPVKEIKKTYVVVLEKTVSAESVSELEKGVEITLETNGLNETYLTKPCKVTLLEANKVEITITEGKKRQIRRMFTSIKNEVVSLNRIKINNLTLDIPVGTHTFISEDEIKKKIFG